MAGYSKKQIENAVKSKGYVWFDSASDFDVNIVGVRNSTTGNVVTNLFDDYMTISYKEKGLWVSKTWAATTDPGKKGMLDATGKGTAVLIPGQYRKSHIIALHQGKYEALCQRGPVKFWRDGNKNMVFDKTNVTEGIVGINIHRSNPETESTYVENWSMGCSVFKRAVDFNNFMAICHNASAIHGNSFTYTLLETKDIV